MISGDTHLPEGDLEKVRIITALYGDGQNRMKKRATLHQFQNTRVKELVSVYVTHSTE